MTEVTPDVSLGGWEGAEKDPWGRGTLERVVLCLRRHLRGRRARRWRARGAGPGEAGDRAGRHAVTLERLLRPQVGPWCRERGEWVPMLGAARPGSVSLAV